MMVRPSRAAADGEAGWRLSPAEGGISSVSLLISLARSQIDVLFRAVRYAL